MTFVGYHNSYDIVESYIRLFSPFEGLNKVQAWKLTRSITFRHLSMYKRFNHKMESMGRA